MEKDIVRTCQRCESAYTYSTDHEIICRKCGYRKKREDLDKPQIAQKDD